MPVSDRGLVVNVQDFAVHDGYGLRSIVFLKGCHLRCKWCQNPECLDSLPEVVFRSGLCIACGRCADICEEGAVSDEEPRIDRRKCTRCMRCTEACPSGALKRVGHWMSPEELLEVVIKYKPFYDGSHKGGVTLSGGEPLDQPDFCRTFLELARRNGIHTAVETSGHADHALFQEIVGAADLALCDIKHMDEQKHRRATGVSNEPILRNLALLAKGPKHVECVIRIPLIPGFNDDKDNVRRTAEFARHLGLRRLDLLPFNDLASSKYKELGKRWEYERVTRQADEDLCHLAKVAESAGAEVTIGGLW